MSAATASLVTHVGLAATLTTSRLGCDASGGHGAAPGRNESVGRHALARLHASTCGRMRDMSADEASAVTPRRRRRHTPRSPTVLGRSARPRRLSSAGSDRPVDLAAIGGSPPRYYGKRRSSGHRKRRATVADEAFFGNRPDICPAGADSRTTSYSSPFVHRKEDEISRRLRDVPDVFLSPLSRAPPTLHPRPAHTPSQGGTLAPRPFLDAIPRDRRARSSRATPRFARRLSQVLGHSFPPDWIGHKATIECFIVSAPLTKVPPRLPPAPRRNNRRNGKG